MSDTLFNRGDSRPLTFKIKTPSGEYVDGSIYDEVEVQFNKQSTFTSIKYLKSKGQVTWDNTNSCFTINLSQQDTFALNDGNVEVQVRLKQGELVKGTATLIVDIGRTLSEKVLDNANG